MGDDEFTISPALAQWMNIDLYVQKACIASSYVTVGVWTCRLCIRTCVGGVPRWLSRLNVWLWFRSRSHGLWLRAPHGTLYCHLLSSQSLFWILCPPLSLCPSPALSLKTKSTSKKEKNKLVFDLQEVLATTKPGCHARKGATGRILKGFCYIIEEMFSLSPSTKLSFSTDCSQQLQ